MFDVNMVGLEVGFLHDGTSLDMHISLRGAKGLEQKNGAACGSALLAG